MPTLGVNIDHIATLRQARLTSYPDPIRAAKTAQDCGADQITCHLREDRRHIQDSDLPQLKEVLSIPLNLEMAVTPEMLAIALKEKPQKVTLVPEKRQELTTEGGLDLLSQGDFLKELMDQLMHARIEVSLFIDPEPKQIEKAESLKADWLEFHTGPYCEALDRTQKQKELERLAHSCALAKEKGFKVAAGHGLNYENIFDVLNIKEIEEYNIGHSLVAHAVMVGWERAIREMKALVL